MARSQISSSGKFRRLSQRPGQKTQSGYRYVLFYKPYDVLSQFTDRSSDRATLKDYVPIPEIYPVGRLDRDSEGLMLLTNDGPLQHRLTDPRYGHPRTYWAQVERIPTAEAIAHLQRGIALQDYRTRPAIVERIDPEPDLPPRVPPIRDRKSVPTCWLQITLGEGRNRQVRRMTAAVGHPTLRLVRVAIGTLTLDGLAPGEWRDLSPSEVKTLRQFRSRL